MKKDIRTMINLGDSDIDREWMSSLECDTIKIMNAFQCKDRHISIHLYSREQLKM